MVDRDTVLGKIFVEVRLASLDHPNGFLLSNYSVNFSECIQCLDFVMKLYFLDRAAFAKLNARDQISLASRKLPEVSNSSNLLAVTLTDRAVRVGFAPFDETAAAHLWKSLCL